MIPQVIKPKSPNITPNPLRVILNHLHYEQRCINQAKQYHSIPKYGSLDVLSKFLEYEYFPLPLLSPFPQRGAIIIFSHHPKQTQEREKGRKEYNKHIIYLFKLLTPFSWSQAWLSLSQSFSFSSFPSPPPSPPQRSTSITTKNHVHSSKKSLWKTSSTNKAQAWPQHRVSYVSSSMIASPMAATLRSSSLPTHTTLMQNVMQTSIFLWQVIFFIDKYVS